MKFSECVKISKSINDINLKNRTKNLYFYLTKQYIASYFNDLCIEDINNEVLQKYLIYLADKKLSTNTIKLIWRLVKSVIKENRLEIDLDNIIIPKTHEKQVNAFTKFEQKQIENKLDVSKNLKHIGILFALYLGLRLGETLALKWEDIDFANKVVNIKKNCLYGNEHTQIFHTQNEEFNKYNTITAFLGDDIKKDMVKNKL